MLCAIAYRPWSYAMLEGTMRMGNRCNYYRGVRHELTRLLPKEYSKVLEIGCGEGGFRKQLHQTHEYWGVEPVESVAANASRRLDKVLLGTYQEVCHEIPNDYFDLVICNDVVEHMNDHDRFFQSIKKKLRRDGYLVASIPNVRHLGNLFEILVKKDWRYENAGILDRTHLRFFTERSLKRTIRDNGFILEEFVGINASYWSRSDIKGVGKRFLYCCCGVIFGRDVKFLQFGIRIKH
jgi:2-polyprenyl-3-methyl-5-hydroxy-6-metoxy-1,4-benzoquinol methylase